MKYQSEYKRNYQKWSPKKETIEERKLRTEVPIRHSSVEPNRRAKSREHHRYSSPFVHSHGLSRSENFAVIGPNEKFSQSYLYRLKEPVNVAPVTKSQEFAILGKQDKFADNVVYPLRKIPVYEEQPKELKQAPRVTFDPNAGRDSIFVKRRDGLETEYQRSFNWKQSVTDPANDQLLLEEARLRDRRSDPTLPSSVIDPSEKLIQRPQSAFDGQQKQTTSVSSNTPAHVDIEIENRKRSRSVEPQRGKSSIKHDTEYQARFKPIPNQRRPKTRKAYEAEQVEDRKRKQLQFAERAYTDDEGDIQLEFRQKYPHGKLRRWKSEYQTTYKPFWKFDYKNGKWFRDSTAEEDGFNPNLFWYKELMSTRKKADEFRANAQADHFSRNHTLQLQGRDSNAWDLDYQQQDDDNDSVISIDRYLEQERAEGRRRREKAHQQEIQSKIHYDKERQQKPSTRDEHVQSGNNRPIVTESATQSDQPHKVDKIVYVDIDNRQRPSEATKAFVRNLGSSSVQHNMAWDSESLYSQDTNPSDTDLKSNTAKEFRHKHYQSKEQDLNNNDVIRTSYQQENPTTINKSRGVGTHSSPSRLNRQSDTGETNGKSYQNDFRSSTTDAKPAAGRPSYDTHNIERHRPQSANYVQAYEDTYNSPNYSQFGRDNNKSKTEVNNKQTQQYSPKNYPKFPSKSSSDNHHTSQHQRSHQNGRFKDEVTEYYYSSNDGRKNVEQKPSFQNHLNTLNEGFGTTYNVNRQQDKDDDVLSVNSARSLSSSCSLASQTLERAKQNMNNMNKYWDDNNRNNRTRTAVNINVYEGLHLHAKGLKQKWLKFKQTMTDFKRTAAVLNYSNASKLNVSRWIQNGYKNDFTLYSSDDSTLKPNTFKHEQENNLLSNSSSSTQAFFITSSSSPSCSTTCSLRSPLNNTNTKPTTTWLAQARLTRIDSHRNSVSQSLLTNNNNNNSNNNNNERLIRSNDDNLQEKLNRVRAQLDAKKQRHLLSIRSTTNNNETFINNDSRRRDAFQKDDKLSSPNSNDLLSMIRTTVPTETEFQKNDNPTTILSFKSIGNSPVSRPFPRLSNLRTSVFSVNSSDLNDRNSSISSYSPPTVANSHTHHHHIHSPSHLTPPSMPCLVEESPSETNTSSGFSEESKSNNDGERQEPTMDENTVSNNPAIIDLTRLIFRIIEAF
ncbi:unnamed protein product [Didymodactylos carnosus]|uniref:Nuclear protein MDM1 n=1 Tax=Didymodactylos carnosus TaxID=1234261 RepID=A0A813ZXA9_9BILA|nr:unnamed protein product [Didymodactylos carnosus]CAF3685943.1 unnamed protein product [Didymodactylos carnosus]